MGFLGPVPIVWSVPPGIGHDPREWEGSAQLRAPPTSANSQGEGGGGPTRPSHCSLLPCRSPCSPHDLLPLGPLPCYPMANLAAALIAESHLRGPPCHRPVLLKGSGIGRAQGGRCISRTPVVKPPARPWVPAATPRTTAASCTERGGDGLWGGSWGARRGGGKSPAVHGEGRVRGIGA